METILYIAIIGIVISSFVLFALTINGNSNKITSATEVQSNMRLAMSIISDKIRSAESINLGSSTFGSDPGTLSLQMANPNNPTIFDLDTDDGRLRMVEGLNPAVYLTSDDVNVTNLTFEDTTGTNPHQQIEITLTIEYNVNKSSQDFYYIQTVSTNETINQ